MSKSEQKRDWLAITKALALNKNICGFCFMLEGPQIHQFAASYHTVVQYSVGIPAAKVNIVVSSRLVLF